MKLTKTLLALAVGGLLACGAALAQDSTNTPSTNAPSRPFPGSRGPNMDRLVQFLGLTDDQKAQVTPILQQRMQKRRAIMQDTSLTRDEKMDQMKELNESVDAQMKQILTPDQYQKWQKMQPRFRRPMQPPPGGTNAPAASTPPAAGT